MLGINPSPQHSLQRVLSAVIYGHAPHPSDDQLARDLEHCRRLIMEECFQHLKSHYPGPLCKRWSTALDASMRTAARTPEICIIPFLLSQPCRKAHSILTGTHRYTRAAGPIQKGRCRRRADLSVAKRSLQHLLQHWAPACFNAAGVSQRTCASPCAFTTGAHAN